ncbi:MAG: Acetyltransferase, family [Herbinix sp.]|jgi:RimJ/RimL family protein N-acetyltransferase|nr:Acetyltransferase, family [Herbinix sp.]
MNIRKTEGKDLDQVMSIYESARQYMRENGNPNQWMNGYPSRELIQEDMKKQCSYVCLDEDEIVGVFRFTKGVDPTYIHIYEGNWLNNEPYGVVHRIASAHRKKGVASYCLQWCQEQCNNVRIDTHRNNTSMQNLLLKNGFHYCGIIYLEDGDERLAYQK